MTEYQLSPSILRRDGGTQPRAVLDEATILEYADALRAGDTFPPVVAYHDGETYWLADGFHRVNAALRAGVVLLTVDVRQGSQRDAILYSAGVNATHGLRRTNDDKRRAVTRLLSDPEWSQWSDREIARRCAVNHHLVADIRAHLGELPDSGRRVTRGGTEYTMQTVNIGAPAQSEQIGRQPAAVHAPTWEIESALFAYLRETIPMEEGSAWLEQAESILADVHLNRAQSERWPAIVAAMPPCRTGDLLIAVANTKYQILQAQRRAAASTSSATEAVEDDDAQSAPDDDVPVTPVDAPARRNGSTARPSSPKSELAEVGNGEAGWYSKPSSTSSPAAVPAEVVRFETPANIGRVIIHHDDARNLVRLLNRESVNLVITSPPYNTGGAVEYDGHDDDMDVAEYLDLLSDVFMACYSVLAPGGRICVNVPFGMGRQPWRPVAGPVADLLTGRTAGALQLEGQIVWDKGTTGNRTTWGSWRRPTHPSLRDTTEAVIVARKLGEPVLPPGALVADGAGGPDVSPWLPGEVFMSLTQDHWQIAPESATRVGHPAPFPVQLAENLIRLYGWPGCTVLDPFAGAGTVGVAVLGLPAGERCRVILVDQSAHYCGLAQARVSKAQEATWQLAL